MMRVICMMGLPRSGKSTVSRVLSMQFAAPVVNRDSIRLALHGERFLKPAEPMVRVLARIMVEALFNAGHGTVIVDETNLKRATRDFWRDGPWATEFLQVQTSKELCIARAQATDDEAIMPVIQAMDDYAEPLDESVEHVSAVLAAEFPAIKAALERATSQQPEGAE